MGDRVCACVRHQHVGMFSLRKLFGFGDNMLMKKNVLEERPLFLICIKMPYGLGAAHVKTLDDGTI